ncbi:MAG: hypothetical protein AB7P76_08910 [Candidatus Melainabacteria bacterium]
MNRMAKLLSIAAIAAAACTGMAAWAYAPEEDLMQIKGYSPEVVELANTQRSRQEWRKPAPPPEKPLEKFFHNIYYNNWTGSFDDFGSEIIRNR